MSTRPISYVALSCLLCCLGISFHTTSASLPPTSKRCATLWQRSVSRWLSNTSPKSVTCPMQQHQPLVTMTDFFRIYARTHSKTHETTPVEIVNLPPGLDQRQCFSDLLRGDYPPSIPSPVVFQYKGYFSEYRRFLLIKYSHEPILISSAFKKVLEKNGITGWKTFPAQCLNREGKEIPNYHGFSITGRCGPRDVSRSKPIIIKGETIYEGIYLDPATWDGSDIFIEEGKYRCQVISPKAAEVFKKQKALLLLPLMEQKFFKEE